MLAKTYGSAVYGVDAFIITIEVDVGQGTQFFMVGLPDSAVKESQQRVEAAIKFYNYHMPRQKIMVNLAPTDIKKEGSFYDLPIALAILSASNQVHIPMLDQYLVIGELSLDGQLRPLRGILPIAIEARKQGFKGFILPKENAREAAIVDQLEIVGVTNIKEAVEHLNGKISLLPCSMIPEKTSSNQNEYEVDFSDVQGQENIKRAFEIAAAGGNNVIMIGPPGAGKTMLAKRLPSILPPLNLYEALETTKIHSVAGKLGVDAHLISARPFQASGTPPYGK